MELVGVDADALEIDAFVFLRGAVPPVEGAAILEVCRHAVLVVLERRVVEEVGGFVLVRDRVEAEGAHLVVDFEASDLQRRVGESAVGEAFLRREGRDVGAHELPVDVERVLRAGADFGANKAEVDGFAVLVILDLRVLAHGLLLARDAVEHGDIARGLDGEVAVVAVEPRPAGAATPVVRLFGPGRKEGDVHLGVELGGRLALVGHAAGLGELHAAPAGLDELAAVARRLPFVGERLGRVEVVGEEKGALRRAGNQRGEDGGKEEYAFHSHGMIMPSA